MPNCAYCHTPLASARDRCPSCGAHGGQPGPGRQAVPTTQTPEPAPTATAPGIGTRFGAGVLWFCGGALGLHCFFAGHTLRGVVYLALIAGIIATMALVPIAPPDSPSPPGAALFSLAAVGLMLALVALWLYDGVRILVGRFP